LETKSLNTFESINVNMIVDYWYDKHTKSWVVQEEALKLVKEYNEEFDLEYKNRNPFPELKDLPKVFIGDVELNPRDLRIGKLKSSKRVTEFSRNR
jgi:hypothetical protein